MESQTRGSFVELIVELIHVLVPSVTGARDLGEVSGLAISILGANLARESKSYEATSHQIASTLLSKRGSELVSRFTKLTKELELYEGDERKRTAALKVLKALSPIGQQNNTNYATINALSTNLKYVDTNPHPRGSPPPIHPVKHKTPNTSTTTTPKSLLSEKAVVTDCLYILGGANGGNIKYDSTSGEYVLPSTVIAGLKRGDVALVRLCCSVGVMYRRLAAFTDTRAKDEGKVESSFRHGVKRELLSYERLLAVLSSQLDHPAGITLKQLRVWVQEPRARLKWLMNISRIGMKETDIIYDNVAPERLQIGRFFTLAQTESHGDKYVRSLCKQLDRSVMAPLVTMIRRWLFEGELYDLSGEFFITKNPEMDRKRKIAEVGRAARADLSYWEWDKQYLVIYGRLPPFISHKFANLICQFGKAVVFLKDCCEDLEWVSDFIRRFAPIFPSVLAPDGTMEALKQVVGQGCKVLSERLMEVMKERYSVIEHCDAIKKHLFLLQGDFAEMLLQGLNTELTKDASRVHLHSLRSILYDATKPTVATYWSPKILACVDVLIRQPTGSQKRTGWDVFELSYRVPVPLDAVLLTEQNMLHYREASKFLCQLKRSQYKISAAWQVNDQLAKLKHVRDDIKSLMHAINLLRSNMGHFVHNVSHYIAFEVVESSWNSFVSSVKVARDLDQLIAGHDDYLKSIRRGIWSSHGGQDQEHLTSADVIEMFAMVDTLDELCQNLYQESIEVSNLRQAASTRQGWSKTDADVEKDEAYAQYLHETVQPKVADLAELFTGSLAEFIGKLIFTIEQPTTTPLEKLHCGFLLHRLDFNGFYTSLLH